MPKSRILVVEDDVDISNMLRIYFDSQGFETHVVGLGQDALDFCRRTPPNLVILDIRMPDIDGYEVGDVPFSFNLEVSDCPWNVEHMLIHVGIQGKKIAFENLPPNNLVFLIDVSGSMNSPEKLPLLKESLSLLVGEMRDIDRIAIVVYAGAAGLVLPPTPCNEVQKIINALERLHAGGSTAGGAGIKLAYAVAKEHLNQQGNNRVILATDGDFNVGPSSNSELVRLIENKRDDGIYLTVLGFGMGNYKDSKMEKLNNMFLRVLYFIYIT